MSKTIGVVLSGCGVYDGAEIHEAVLTLLFLTRAGVNIKMYAPDKPQMHVINHLNGEEMKESRNVLVESARIARGKVEALSAANVAELDAVIFPGGFGAAKNLSDFAVKGSAGTVDPDVKKLVAAMHQAKKPLGFICISPASVGAMSLQGAGVTLTIGSDEGTNQAITATGNKPENTTVDQITMDETHNVVSTSAYMCASNIAEAATGIEKLVQEVLRRTGVALSV